MTGLLFDFAKTGKLNQIHCETRRGICDCTLKSNQIIRYLWLSQFNLTASTALYQKPTTLSMNRSAGAREEEIRKKVKSQTYVSKH